MQKEFEMNMQLKDADLNVIKDKEKFKEDRKDDDLVVLPYSVD